MTVQGRLIKLFDTVESDKGFKKREFILETEYSTQYPQEIKFQLTNDKVNLLDSVAKNTDMTIHFNLRGRRWEAPDGKMLWFTTLAAWKCEIPKAKEPPLVSDNEISKKADSETEEEMPF